MTLSLPGEDTILLVLSFFRGSGVRFPHMGKALRGHHAQSNIPNEIYLRNARLGSIDSQ